MEENRYDDVSNFQVESNHTKDLLVFMAMAIGSFLLAQIVSAGFLMAMGVDIMSLAFMGDAIDENMTVFKWTQIISAILIFMVPSLFFSKYKTGSFWGYFRPKNGIHGEPVLISALALLASYPLLMVAMQLNSYLTLPDSLIAIEEWMRSSEDMAAELIGKFLVMDSVGSFALNMFMIAVLPAVGEELIFRGCLQKLFQRISGNGHVAVIVAAFIFSFIHLQFYGFLARWLLGIVLGYLFLYSGNIWYPILGHFFNNGFQVLMVYLGFTPTDDVTAPELPALDWTYLAYAVVGLIVLGILFYFYRKHFHERGQSGYQLGKDF